MSSAEGNPTKEQVVSSMAAMTAMLSPEGMKELHAALDEISGAAGEKAFSRARSKLADALAMRVGRIASSEV
jgi:hypothetical protein